MGENESEPVAPGHRIELLLHVGDTGALEPDDLGSLTALLREELLDLDVDDVRPAGGGAAPPGSKGVELAAIGALVVRLVKSRKALADVVRTIAGWVERSGTRSVRVQMGADVLEVTGISSKDQRAVIDAWIERQNAGTT